MHDSVVLQLGEKWGHDAGTAGAHRAASSRGKDYFVSTERFGARPRERGSSHARTAARGAVPRGGTGLLSAKVTTPATLLAVVLGYALDGSPGAVITGGLTFLTFPVVSITNALAQYLKARTLQQAPAHTPTPTPTPSAPPSGPATALAAAVPTGELIELPQAADHGGATFWGRCRRTSGAPSSPWHAATPTARRTRCAARAGPPPRSS